MILGLCFFFFQAEDGIRDYKVTGVQTCALPILPSDFGFPIVVHPHDPDTVYVVPLEPATRTCPGGTPAVWRSENGGGSWQKLARGLPKKESYFTVLRDALDIDELSSPALYFGTTTRQLWIGRDGGEK